MPLLPVRPRAILAAALACAAAATAAEGGPIRPVALVEAVQYSSRRVLWGQGDKPPADEPLPSMRRHRGRAQAVGDGLK
jgi:hypothetical protein